jgi:hypothetical protein
VNCEQNVKSHPFKLSSLVFQREGAGLAQSIQRLGYKLDDRGSIRGMDNGILGVPNPGDKEAGA